MLRMTSTTTIGDLRLRGLTSCVVESSWDTLTDTCTLSMPRRVRWKGRSLAVGEGSLLKAGQDVHVALGYDGLDVDRFVGQVRNVSTGLPIEVSCEDSLELKSGSITTSYRDVTLEEVLDDVLPTDYKLLADYRLGKIRITRLTPMQILEELREKYGVLSWFRDGVLHAGLAIDVEAQRRFRIRWDRNRIEDDLEWRSADDVRINATGIIIRPNGTKLEVVAGDRDGEARSFHYYDRPEADVKRLLDEQIDRLRYTGYRGTVTTFLEPHIRHGDIVELVNPELPEQDGAYLVASVSTGFGNNGGRQMLTLETKVR